MYVGKKIKELRQQLGYNQTEFADLLGVSQPYYSAIELGKKKISDKLVKLIKEKWGVDFSFGNSKNGGVISDKLGGISNNITLNEYKWRAMQAREIEKDEEWLKINIRVQTLQKKVNFYYQRIVDIRILLINILKVGITGNLAIDNEADIMHEVFKDDTNGILRREYSTSEELLIFETELTNLCEIFENRFFQLFRILYNHLRTDLKV